MQRSGVLPAERTRKRLIRIQSVSDPKYGKKPSERNTAELLDAGVVVLDKPSGPSSHQVTAWLRKALDVKAVGHGGTLDPKVTGVLPVSVGRATKAIQALLKSGKEYICVMRMHEDVDEAKVLKTASKFLGVIEQTPPVRSAVKRRPRKRRIYYLDVLEVSGRDVMFRVGCQAGTYIRNLCVDMGRDMGVKAHMQELRRSRTGLLDESAAVTLHDALDARKFAEAGDDSWLFNVVQPVESITAHLSKIVVRDSAVEAVCNGAPLAVVGIAQLDAGIEPDELVVMETLKGELIALATAQMTSKNMQADGKGIAATPNSVIMRQGTYPRVWKQSKA